MPFGGFLPYGNQNTVNRRLNRVNAPQPAVTQPTFQQAQRVAPATPALPARPTTPAVNRPSPSVVSGGGPAPVNDGFRQNVLSALLQRAQPAGGEGPFTPEDFRGASRQFGQSRAAPQGGFRQPQQGFDRGNIGRLLLQVLQRRRQNAAPRGLL